MVVAVFLPLTFATGYFEMNFRLITQFHGGVSMAMWAVVLPSRLGAGTVPLPFLIRRDGNHLIPPRNRRVVTDANSTEPPDRGHSAEARGLTSRSSSHCRSRNGG